MKINQRVTTQYGIGTIKAIDGPYGSQSNQWHRYGILHDTYPVNVPAMYTNDIIYFTANEIKSA